MNVRIVRPAAVVALALMLVRCGGGGGSGKSPTEPPPSGDGSLVFFYAACICLNDPYSPITIYVDGRQAGTLQASRDLVLPLPPGQYTWSTTAGDQGSTPVVISPGGTAAFTILPGRPCSDCAGVSNYQVPELLP